MLWQPSLPERYTRAAPDDLAAAITARRKQLGDSLVILGHHYQTDEIIRHADVTGDSLKLSQTAARIATERPVRWVVFCGVHFMAETAAILSPETVVVYATIKGLDFVSLGWLTHSAPALDLSLLLEAGSP